MFAIGAFLIVHIWSSPASSTGQSTIWKIPSAHWTLMVHLKNGASEKRISARRTHDGAGLPHGNVPKICMIRLPVVREK
jgi:hypothetical protein